MDHQPRYNPLQESGFFADQMASRPLVEGTVARGHLRTDKHFFTGKVDGKVAETLPSRIVDNWDARKLLLRGQERYAIHCSPCHGLVGNGEGMVVRRGFPKPPSYHIERLRTAPIGHFFDVPTNGFGRMSSYASQVPTEDRWAIAAYIRALQLSQAVPFAELPEKDQQQLRDLNP